MNPHQGRHIPWQVTNVSLVEDRRKQNPLPTSNLIFYFTLHMKRFHVNGSVSNKPCTCNSSVGLAKSILFVFITKINITTYTKGEQWHVKQNSHNQKFRVCHYPGLCKGLEVLSLTSKRLFTVVQWALLFMQSHHIQAWILGISINHTRELGWHILKFIQDSQLCSPIPILFFPSVSFDGDSIIDCIFRDIGSKQDSVFFWQ